MSKGVFHHHGRAFEPPTGSMSRLSRRSDERDHLILQVLMLVEKEVTAVLNIQRQLAQKLGVKDLGPDVAQLSQQTSIDEVAQTIKESVQTE